MFSDSWHLKLETRQIFFRNWNTIDPSWFRLWYTNEFQSRRSNKNKMKDDEWLGYGNRKHSLKYTRLPEVSQAEVLTVSKDSFILFLFVPYAVNCECVQPHFWWKLAEAFVVSQYSVLRNQYWVFFPNLQGCKFEQRRSALRSLEVSETEMRERLPVRSTFRVWWRRRAFHKIFGAGSTPRSRLWLRCAHLRLAATGILNTAL